MRVSSPDTRQRLLRAAVKQFVRRGYAAASVQAIVTEAQVTKPALYYHFGSKTGLYKALMETAQEERLRLMQAAVRPGHTTAQKLEAMLAALFDYARRHADLLRLAFATAFASREEVPPAARCTRRGRRNFEFVRDLMAEGQAAGELRRDLRPEHLALAFYGHLISHLLLHLEAPRSSLSRLTSREVVGLFLEGAAPRLPS